MCVQKLISSPIFRVLVVLLSKVMGRDHHQSVQPQTQAELPKPRPTNATDNCQGELNAQPQMHCPKRPVCNSSELCTCIPWYSLMFIGVSLNFHFKSTNEHSSCHMSKLMQRVCEDSQQPRHAHHATEKSTLHICITLRKHVVDQDMPILSSVCHTHVVNVKKNITPIWFLPMYEIMTTTSDCGPQNRERGNEIHHGT